MRSDAWTVADPCVCQVCGLEACEDHLPADGNAKPVSTPGLVGITLADLATTVFPERRALLLRQDTAVVREGHIGEVYAERGFGKTWFCQTLGLIAATGSEALGFRAPTPCRVAYVDGEMAAGEIQERFALLQERLQLPATDQLTLVAADWQESFLPRIDTTVGQDALEPFIAPADLVILDNRSCLFDPEAEKDASAWQPAQDYLLSLRRRGKAVLIAHHSNRLGGARGHSKPEDLMNLLIKLARPDDYRQEQGARFLVTFDKCRGAYGPAVSQFLAHLTLEGWQHQPVDDIAAQQTSTADRVREFVQLSAAAGARVKSANAAITGTKVNRNAGLKVWAELLQSRAILQHHEGGFFVP